MAVIAPGKVYRRDSDLTHTPMFHQIEGLLVDTNVSMADLRGTLTHFMQRIFGPEDPRPLPAQLFPLYRAQRRGGRFLLHVRRHGLYWATDTCRVCKQTGWVEILGCGHGRSRGLQGRGLRSREVYTGFAFGLGVERVAMLKYGIGDLRMFFENDIRFIQQFA